MGPLEKLLTKDNQFFELLEASARQAHESVQALKQFVDAPDQAKSLDLFAESRRKDKAITRQLNELLCTHFVSALEREDVEALSNALYKIPKTVEKVGERMIVAPHFMKGLQILPQIAVLEKATALVLGMIQVLRQGPTLDKIKQQNELLQDLEGEADKLLVDLLKELYATPMEGNRALYQKDLFELLERVIDRCRDAGNVIRDITLKNS